MELLAEPSNSDGSVESCGEIGGAVLERLITAALEIDSMFETALFGSYSLGIDGTYATINGLELSWMSATREDLIGRKHPGIS